MRFDFDWLLLYLLFKMWYILSNTCKVSSSTYRFNFYWLLNFKMWYILSNTCKILSSIYLRNIIRLTHLFFLIIIWYRWYNCCIYFRNIIRLALLFFLIIIWYRWCNCCAILCVLCY